MNDLIVTCPICGTSVTVRPMINQVDVRRSGLQIYFNSAWAEHKCEGDR